MSELNISNVLENFTSTELLNALGFDEDLCFSSDEEVGDYATENADYIGLSLEPEFQYQNDKDVYERIVELLENDKLTYSDWDDFLRRYEY